MNNSATLKNELIFQYAAGISSMSKSMMAATYLYLNSKEIKLYSQFENYCGQELGKTDKVYPTKLTMEDCVNDADNDKINNKNLPRTKNPLNTIVKDFNNISWKKIFNGFYEYQIKFNRSESAKLIKMDPGAKVPLHSHNGREYILVLDGSFCDEYGTYLKGNLQINDSKIKHTPVANAIEGCICLTITEDDLVFYGPFAPILNLFTFIKSLFSYQK
jgi:putative transcriptional regulator